MAIQIENSVASPPGKDRDTHPQAEKTGLRMKLRTKLTLGFLAVALVVFGSGFFSLHTYYNISEEFSLLQKDVIPGALSMLETEAAVASLLVKVDEIVSTGDVTHQERAMEAITRIQKNTAEHTAHEIHIGEEESRVAQDMEDRARRIISLAEQVMDAVKAGGSRAKVADSQRQMHTETEELAVVLKDHVAVHMSELAEVEENVHRVQVVGIQAVWVAIIVALVLSLGVGFYTARSVLEPIYLLSAAAESVSRGDLNVVVDVKPGDEMGVLAAAFNQMVENLRHLLDQTAETSQQLSASSEELTAMMKQMNTASEQVAVTTGEMAQGAATQAHRAEEASRSAALLATATGQIAANAHQSNDASAQAQKLVQDSAQVVDALSDKLGEIKRVVALVDKIADQTNLLALNASIEAARAGEHGAGFAVVADEVRRLAEHSAASVGEIAALSQQIGDSLREVLAAMGEAQKGTAHTAALAQETAATTKEQEKVSETMVSAVNEMAAVAEENAAASEEIAASIEEQVTSMEQVANSAQMLAEMANSLQQIVSEFTVASGLTCPHFAACPIFERSSAETSKYVGQYCKGDFEECERKKRQDAGQPVPPTLLPDGGSLF